MSGRVLRTSSGGVSDEAVGLQRSTYDFGAQLEGVGNPKPRAVAKKPSFGRSYYMVAAPAANDPNLRNCA